jgi:hypothetical protein
MPGDGGMDSSAVDFMRVIVEESNRKCEVVLELKEKIAVLEFEKRISDHKKLVACKVISTMSFN